MDNEVVVHIYNGRLLNHKKECIWVSSNDVVEPWAYYAEWSKSEREKQMLYINVCIWNLERWHWCICLQGSSGDIDIKNRLVDRVGEGEDGANWESSTETCTLPYINRYAVGICSVTHQAQTYSVTT